MNEAYDLARFVRAQETAYPRALAELRGGAKRTHWMWYVFPQLAGLGRSDEARRYGIRDAGEAGAYLRHPVLGPRLAECAQAVLDIQDGSARQVFGTPDDLKLRSSATLFAAVSPPGSVFHQLLDRYFEGRLDDRSLDMLGQAEG